VSQGFLSQVERGHRSVTPRLQTKVARLTGVPTLMPVNPPMDWTNLSNPNDNLARALASLGYPGFSHLRKRGSVEHNPAEVLLGALLQDNLDSRVAEALPWLVLNNIGMDWHWVVREAKVHDLQNKLGFVVAMARALAGRREDHDVVHKLGELEARLERSRLEKEETFCYASLTNAERNWLGDNRSDLAFRWRLLSDLSPLQLSYAR
jgi:hypothetical protein